MKFLKQSPRGNDFLLYLSLCLSLLGASPSLLFAQIPTQTDTTLVWQDSLKADWVLLPQAYPMYQADTSGLYILGGFKGELSHRGKALTSSDRTHKGVLLKYAPEGNLRWYKNFSSERELLLGHLKRFPSGDLGIVGYASDSATLLDYPSYQKGGFALTASPEGTLHKLIQQELRDHVFPDLDLDLGFYVTQSYADSVVLDSTHIYYDKSEYPNSLLAVYSPNKHLRWHRLLDTIPDFYRTGALYAHGIAVGEDKQIFVAGYFNDAPFLGKDHLRAFKSRDLFIAAYDSLGTPLWSTQLSSSERDFFLYKMYYRHDLNELIVEARSRPGTKGQPDLHHRFYVSPKGARVRQTLASLSPSNQTFPTSLLAERLPVSEDAFYQLHFRESTLVIEYFEIERKLSLVPDDTLLTGHQ